MRSTTELSVQIAEIAEDLREVGGHEASLLDILRFAKGERTQLVFGVIATLVAGLVIPCFALLYGQFFLVLSTTFNLETGGGEASNELVDYIIRAVDLFPFIFVDKFL